MHWWHKGTPHADLNRELQSDLGLEEEEQKERGLSPEEARYAALRAFGNPTLIRDDTRDVWGWTMIENLLPDLRVGIRALFLSPGFSLMAVLVIALCIGAATLLFTVVQSTLLRPLPFRDPERLIALYEHFRDPGMNLQQFNYNAVSPGDYYDWRAQTHGFEDMAAWRWWRFSLTGDHGEVPEMLEAGGSSWNLFPLLGVHALIGRTFLQSEDRPNGDSVMLTWNFSRVGSVATHRFSAGKSIWTGSHTQWWAYFQNGSLTPTPRYRSGFHTRRGCRLRSSSIMTFTSVM